MSPLPRRAPALRALTACCLLVAGCAGHGRDCDSLAGPGWGRLSHAPDNSAGLLAQESLPDAHGVRWYHDSSGKRVLACFYQPGLVNPACGGSTAYVFQRAGDGSWRYLSQAMQQCENSPD